MTKTRPDEWMPADPEDRAKMALGVLLRRWRIMQEDSQETVAKTLGTRQPVVARYEKGNDFPASADIQRRLARYLDMPLPLLRSMIARDRLEHREATLEAELREVRAEKIRTFKVQ